MKTVFVKQLRAGQELFDQPFLLLDATQRETRDGRPYLLFNLGDNSGRVSGIFWNVPDEVLQTCVTGRVVLVTGDVRLYNKRLQVAALDLQPFEPATMADFVTSGGRDRDEMIAELRQAIAELSEPLRELASHILLEPFFLRRYAEAPAATIMHHAYVGGLLEHVLAMIALGRKAAELYPKVNGDLLIAGVLLHDVGKVTAYETRETFPLTDDGRLVGHLARGALMVDAAITEMEEFPSELRQQLIHMLLSHHGTTEWGSPVPPRTLEAVLLHQIDMLDSRARGFVDHVEAEPGDGAWTSPSPMFGYELMRIS